MKKRILATVLACVMTVASAAVLSSCGGGEQGSSDEVTISIGSLPSQETEPERYQVYLDYIEKYEEMYPGRKVEIYTSNMDDMDQVMANAAAGLLFRYRALQKDLLCHNRSGPRKKMCKQYLTNLDKAKITGISLTRLVNNTIGFYLSTGYGYAEGRPERS